MPAPKKAKPHEVVALGEKFVDVFVERVIAEFPAYMRQQVELYDWLFSGDEVQRSRRKGELKQLFLGILDSEGIFAKRMHAEDLDKLTDALNGSPDGLPTETITRLHQMVMSPTSPDESRKSELAHEALSLAEAGLSQSEIARRLLPLEHAKAPDAAERKVFRWLVEMRPLNEALERLRSSASNDRSGDLD